MGYEIKYKVTQNAVIMNYNLQNIVFNNYGLYNKNRFNNFKQIILTEQPQNINEVFRYARYSQIKPTSTNSRIIF